MDPLAKSARTWHQGEFVTALELVAFAVHPGSTESTTTLCLYPQRSTVYLTSQSNFKFEGTDVEALRIIIDGLIDALGHQDKSQFWLDHCVLAEEKPKRTQKAEKSESAKVDKIYKGIYDTMFRRFLSDYEGKRSTLEKLKTKFDRVQVVKTQDIFDYSVETTGIHGESRIVRYLYIDGLREWRALFVSDPIAELEDTKSTYEEIFVTNIRELGLSMASSQLACRGCSDLCDDLGIRRGTTGSEHPANWVHPITGITRTGGVKVEKLDRYHAAHFGLHG